MRPLVWLVITLTFCQVSFSQIETNASPALWAYYSGKDKKVSFLMPRLPVFLLASNHCDGEETETYAAYTDGAVYRIDITSKVEPRENCFQKRNFDENNFVRRVASLRAQMAEEKNSENNILGKITIKLTGNGKITKIVNDYENKRWFELTVYGADETKKEVKNYFASLKNEASPTGIVIGQGAFQTFGDDVSGDAAEIKTLNNYFKTDQREFEEIFTDISVKIKDTGEKPFVVVLKPRADYTDAGRQSKIQGRVILKVSFMGNGAIGKVVPMVELPHGLTEQAVKAARKIVFIPPQKDGVRYSTVKTVEYGFKIF